MGIIASSEYDCKRDPNSKDFIETWLTLWTGRRPSRLQAPLMRREPTSQGGTLHKSSGCWDVEIQTMTAKSSRMHFSSLKSPSISPKMINTQAHWKTLYGLNRNIRQRKYCMKKI